MFEIQDNFLDQYIFDDLENLMMSEIIPWHYQDKSVYPAPSYVFIHLFYQWPKGVESNYFRNLESTLDLFDPMSIYRIKANLLTSTPEIIPNVFHQDMMEQSTRVKKQWTTAILYMNTNNGYTEFKDGTKVESVANRLVSFPVDTWHRGSSCTDQNIRVVINFNYFPNELDPKFIEDDREEF